MVFGGKPKRQMKSPHGSSMNYIKWLYTRRKDQQEKKLKNLSTQIDTKFVPMEERDQEADVDPNAYGDC